ERVRELLEVRLRTERIFLQNLKAKAIELRKLLDAVNDHWVYEDAIYRFYHQSYKVYALQLRTTEMAAALASLSPENRPFCDYFQQLLRAGTNRTFRPEVNDRWVEETAPIIHAFLHARYFLEMAVKYSDIPEPPQPMPSGYA